MAAKSKFLHQKNLFFSFSKKERGRADLFIKDGIRKTSYELLAIIFLFGWGELSSKRS
jgi:hypothetical protein